MVKTEISEARERAREINARYFSEHIESYQNKIQTLDTYQNIRRALNSELIGMGDLIDIGNGGVFDYDTTLAKTIVAVDVCFEHMNDQEISRHLPPNAIAKAGDALALPFPDASFNGSVIVMLIHHLVGRTVNESIQLGSKSLSEAYRVLKPGGKLVLIESCVPWWVYQVERLLFALVAPVIRKISKHPPTLQYTPDKMELIVKDLAHSVKVKRIPLGKWVVIYGFKLPAFLIPVCPYLFVVEKPT